MLVLSRQRDETIMIGDEIEITVVDIRGDKVRLGITAPTRVPVHRKEVYEAIKRENEEAARANGAIAPGDLAVPSGAERASRAASLASKPLARQTPQAAVTRPPRAAAASRPRAGG